MDYLSMLTNSAILLRGKVVQDHTFLEKLMQSFVTVHYCTDPAKANEFTEYVICQHLPFDKTREIFTHIIRIHYPEDYKKYKKELKYIIEVNDERNIVGHYLLNSSEEGVKHYATKQEITFMKFKNGMNQEAFSQKRVDTFHEKIVAIQLMFEKIHPLNNLK